MLKRTAIFSAILLGLAVPSTAQKGERGERRAPTRAQRVLREPVTQSPRSRSVATRPARRLGRSDLRGTAGRNHGQRGRRTPILVVNRDLRYHYETRKVWVPGAIRQVLVPARYETRWDCHCHAYVQVLVRAAYYTTVQDPGCWEYRRVRVAHGNARYRRRASGVRSGIHFHF